MTKMIQIALIGLLLASPLTAQIIYLQVEGTNLLRPAPNMILIIDGVWVEPDQSLYQPAYDKCLQTVQPTVVGPGDPTCITVAKAAVRGEAERRALRAIYRLYIGDDAPTVLKEERVFLAEIESEQSAQ